MAERGYFLLYRGWRQSEVFKDEPLTEREAWVWLIEEAAYKPRQREIAGKTIGLQRGEIAASLTFLERAWKWSRDRVRWFLSKLEKHGMVAFDKRVGITVIAVCNYDQYQPGKGQNHPTASTTASTTANTTADAAENCEESDTDPTANPTAHTTASTTNEKEGLINNGCKAVAEGGGRPEFAAEAAKVAAECRRIIGVDQSWAGFMQHGPVWRWLREGAQPERDIYPTIKAIMARKARPPNGFAYFTQAVADAKAANEQPMPEGKPDDTRPYQTQRRPKRSANPLFDADDEGQDGDRAVALNRW